MGKRILLTALAICLSCLLAACQGQNPPPDESRPVEETVELIQKQVNLYLGEQR